MSVQKETSEFNKRSIISHVKDCFQAILICFRTRKHYYFWVHKPGFLIPSFSWGDLSLMGYWQHRSVGWWGEILHQTDFSGLVLVLSLPQANLWCWAYFRCGGVTLWVLNKTLQFEAKFTIQFCTNPECHLQLEEGQKPGVSPNWK